MLSSRSKVRSSRRQETPFIGIWIEFESPHVDCYQPVEKEPLPGSRRREETPFINIGAKFESSDVGCHGFLTGC